MPRRIQPKKATKNTLTPTSEDWSRAEESWKVLKATHSYISDVTLLPFHLDLWALYNQNPKSLVGMPVMMIAQSDYAILQSRAYPVSILKVTEQNGMPMFRCLFHPIEEERWDGEKIMELKLLQVMPVFAVEQVTEVSRTQIQKQIAFARLLNNINATRNSHIKRLQAQHEAYEHSIENHEREIIRYQKAIKQTVTQLSAAKDQSLDWEGLQVIITSIATSAKVSWVYLAANGDLIVQTKMLYATNPETHQEDTATEIGRFVLRINTTENIIKATNLDYSSRAHQHPNISSGDICLGANDAEVKNLLKAGKYYELVDFLILFFSLFPHDGGDPYISHSGWLADKTPSRRDNPWTHAVKLFEATNTTGTKVHRKKTKATSEAKVVPAPVVTPQSVAEVEDLSNCPTCDCQCRDCVCERETCGTCDCTEVQCSDCTCICDDCDCDNHECSRCGCGEEESCSECDCTCEDCVCEDQHCGECGCGEDPEVEEDAPPF